MPLPYYYVARYLVLLLGFHWRRGRDVVTASARCEEFEVKYVNNQPYVRIVVITLTLFGMSPYVPLRLVSISIYM